MANKEASPVTGIKSPTNGLASFPFGRDMGGALRVYYGSYTGAAALNDTITFAKVGANERHILTMVHTDGLGAGVTLDVGTKDWADGTKNLDVDRLCDGLDLSAATTAPLFSNEPITSNYVTTVETELFATVLGAASDGDTIRIVSLWAAQS